MAAGTYVRRITDLFVEGTELVLRDEPEALLMWVQKLNPFEHDEARHDGQVARARMILSLQDESSDELLLFRSSLHGLTDDQLAGSIADTSYSADLVKVHDEIRSDPKWRERVDVMERSAEQLDAERRADDDPEQQTLLRINQEYLLEVQKRLNDRREFRLDEMKGEPRAELEKRYEAAWIDERGTQSFLGQFRLTELWYASRVCAATHRGENGRWDHGDCDHGKRAFDHRGEIKLLPDPLLAQMRDALARVQMSPGEARFSDRPGSSSASSPRPSAEEEGSTASTPAETSTAAAGTSPSPSATP